MRLTSQLKSYNFAKTLRKWKLDREIDKRKRSKSTDSDLGDFNEADFGNEAEDVSLIMAILLVCHRLRKIEKFN